MKKLFTVLLSLAISAIILATPAFAATTYPYSPSEVLDNFETAFKPVYAQINTDLHDVLDKAIIWSPTVALQNFTIGWADGTEVGYSFTFIDVNNPDKALDFTPVLTGGFAQSEIARTPDMKYGIYKVPMRLRDLIPAMKEDKTLMPTLNSLIKDGCNTSVRFTLKKTSLNRLAWYMEFRSSNDTGDKSLTCKSYLVSVIAESITTPVFTTQLLK